MQSSLDGCRISLPDRRRRVDVGPKQNQNSTKFSVPALHRWRRENRRGKVGRSMPYFILPVKQRPVQVTVRSMLRDRCPVCLSVKLVDCGQTVGWIKMPHGTEVGLSPGDIVLDGDSAPQGKGHSNTHFSAHVYCGQTVAHLSNCWALVGTARLVLAYCLLDFHGLWAVLVLTKCRCGAYVDTLPVLQGRSIAYRV